MEAEQIKNEFNFFQNGSILLSSKEKLIYLLNRGLLKPLALFFVLPILFFNITYFIDPKLIKFIFYSGGAGHIVFSLILADIIFSMLKDNNDKRLFIGKGIEKKFSSIIIPLTILLSSAIGVLSYDNLWLQYLSN